MLQPSKKIKQDSLGVKTTYIFPNWVVEDLAYRDKFTKSQFSRICNTVPPSTILSSKAFSRFQRLSGAVKFHLHYHRKSGDFPIVQATDALDDLFGLPKSSTKRILLKKKEETYWRRELMTALANMLLQSDELPFSYDKLDMPLFEAVLNDPVVVEERALALWNEFIENCQIPSSFLVSTRPSLSFYELMKIRSGRDKLPNQIFAEKYPWATRLKENRKMGQLSNSVSTLGSTKTANFVICCTSKPDCAKAKKLATQLTRHSNNGRLDLLLCDSRYRHILVDAYDKDEDVLPHIVENVPLAKKQLDRALDFYSVYQKYISEDAEYTPHALVILLFRMMIRGKFKTDERLIPEEIVRGLAAVSADSLSAFVAKNWRNGLDPDVSEWLYEEGMTAVLNEGIMAFLEYIGRSNPPLLTIHQLIEFASKVNRNYQCDPTKSQSVPDSNWPTPMDWGFELDRWFDMVRVEVVSNRRRYLNEAEMMKNFTYLHKEDNIRDAFLGTKVYVSIGAPDERATLLLEPKFNDNENTVLDWSQVQIESRRNEDPSPMCQVTAIKIVNRLRKQCPRKIGEKKNCRFDWILKPDTRTVFNPDEIEARSIWQKVYANHLPEHFSNIDPETIVGPRTNLDWKAPRYYPPSGQEGSYCLLQRLQMTKYW